MIDVREKWDNIYQGRENSQPGKGDKVLCENTHLLPKSGNALEIACGLGANALVLADSGLQTDAWDISPVAIEQLQAIAIEKGLPLKGEARDVMLRPPAPESYDVIVVSHFLERDLATHIIAALRADGLLLYQTFTRIQVSNSGPKNEAFRLAENELLEMYSSLKILVYREEGHVGDVTKGFRDEALLVAQKK